MKILGTIISSCSYADEVLIDDEVLIPRNNNLDLAPKKINNVSSFKMQGTHNFYCLVSISCICQFI